MADTENVEIVIKGKFENGQLIVDTTKSIQKGLDDVAKQAASTEKQTSFLIDVLKKLAAVVGITALANQFKNLVKGSLEAAGTMQQVNVALTTMIGSADKAANLQKDLIAFAKQTPFQIDGIFDTTKQLLAYGIAQEDIIPTMSTLGNIAAGVGVDMGRLAVAFGQVKATGHLMGQDLNQFTQAGVPLLAELAKIMGKTEAEVIKLKESGSISFYAVQKALESLTNEGGRFYNLMQDQSKTFLGTISNMADSFYQVRVALGNALLPVAQEVVNWMIVKFGELKNFIDQNKDSIAKFASVLISAFSIVGQAIKLAWSALEAFIAGLKIILSIPFVKEILAAAAAVLIFSKGLAVLTVAFRLLVTTSAGWLTILGLIITGVGYFSKGIDELPDIIKEAALNILKAFELMKAGIFDFIESILDKLSTLADFPGFGWVDDAKKKFASLKADSIKNVEDINKSLEELKSPNISGQANITGPAAVPAPKMEPIDQSKLLVQPEIDPEKEEQKRLKALRAENEALLEEQKNFLQGYGANETEADRLMIDNKTLALQQQILATKEYQDRVNDLNVQMVEGEISRDQYLAGLRQINNDAKNQALEQQYAEEQKLYTAATEEMNTIKLQMQATEDEAELAQLQIRLDQEQQIRDGAAQKLAQSKQISEDQRKQMEAKATEDRLKHQAKMDTYEYQAAVQVSGQLVALQNSKNKELAAIGKAAAIFQIVNQTATGAISAYASLSPIPIVGPVLGAAAAAAIIAYGAEQLSTAKSNSFAVGTPNIPQDQMAMVHQGEMIVPATFSDAIRSGDLSLSGGNVLDSQNNSAASIINNININFEGAKFVGKMDDEDIISIGERLGQLINEDIIPALPK